MPASALIGIDWGTSAARAYRIGPDGAVMDVRHAPLGVQKLAAGRGFADALAQLLGPWHDDPAPRLACGMIGSRQGWREAPYVRCPATVDELVAGIVATGGDELAIVPGVITRDAAGMPDVMRGEETQIVGAIDGEAGSVLAVLPGTHSKWVRVEHGRLVDFQTCMTGELYAVLLEHSILGRLAERGSPGQDDDAFARGVARGLGSGGLQHDLFGARTLCLVGELAPTGVADWLSGLLIGREVRTARNWAFRAGNDASTVRVIGADALTERYVAALVAAGIDATRGPADAAPRGLWQIARRAGRVNVE